MIQIIKILIFLLMLNSYSALSDEKFENIIRLMGKKPYLALEKIKSKLRTSPEEPRLLFYKGIVETKINKIDDAINTFTTLINIHPSLPEPYNNLAVLYADRGELKLAKNTLVKAIKTNSSYSTAHINLGDIYTRMATDAYNKALELDSQNKIAHNKLKLITELFNYQPNTKEKKINTAYVDNKTQKIKNIKNKSEIKKEILEAIESWRISWQSKNIDDYLDSYSDNFEYPDGMNAEQWRKYRQGRIINKQRIKLEITKINYKIEKAIVSVKFIQNYTSDNYKQKSIKTLIFQNEFNAWKIIKEFSG
jgi:tetratricopeptide (TPR) repeat protein